MADNKPYNCLSRRRFLQLGAMGIAGLSYASWLNPVAAAAAARPSGKTKSCILLWMSGGPSHVDTWDPKTESPDGYRGPFGEIKTSVPGMHLTSLFPSLAKIGHELAVVRSMSSKEVDHFRACYHAHTGYQQRSGGVDYPSLGAVVSLKLEDPENALPGYILFPRSKPSTGTGSGFLGPDYQPLRVSGDGVIANASSPVTPTQFAQQAELLSQLNNEFLDSKGGMAIKSQASTVSRAVRMMSSDKLDAFDVSHEADNVQDAYGRNEFGAGCLRARRLVEAGVPFVEVYSTDWDSHANLDANTGGLAQEFDQGASTLITDLKDRGMLDDTLVVMCGEFGRTPKINESKGRDHYAKAWSAALAGAGLQGGAVIGATDKTGTEVTDRPITIVNYLATIYTLLGIDIEKPLPSPGDRPIPIVDNQNYDAEPLTEIL